MIAVSIAHTARYHARQFKTKGRAVPQRQTLATKTFTTPAVVNAFESRARASAFGNWMRLETLTRVAGADLLQRVGLNVVKQGTLSQSAFGHLYVSYRRRYFCSPTTT